MKLLSALVVLVLLVSSASAGETFAIQNTITVTGANGAVTRAVQGTAMKMTASGVAMGKSVSWSVTDLAGDPSDLAAIVSINPLTAILTISPDSKGTIKVVAAANYDPADHGYQIIEIDDENILTIDDRDVSITYSPAGSGESWEESTKAGAWGGTATYVIPPEDDSYSRAAPAYAEFTFTGTAVQWIGESNYGCGKAEVYIDANKEATIDPFIAPDNYSQFVNFSREGLPHGSHTIKIVAAGIKNPASTVYPGTRVLIDAFRYFSGTPEVPDGPAVALTGRNAVSPGETFTVGIHLENVTRSVYAQDLALSYDAGLFEYIDAAAVAGTQILGVDTDAPGSLRLVSVSIDGITGDSTPIIDVSFRAKEGAPAGPGVISVTKAELGIMPEGQVEQAALTSKTIFITTDGSVDKSGLAAAITAAQVLYDNTEIGIENGQCWAAPKAAFQAAIAEAQEVYGETNASQAEIDDAVEALNNAKAEFEASIINAATGDLNNNHSIDVGDLAIVAFYYGADSADEDWLAAKAADINRDGVVDIEDLAFIAMRIP